MVPCTAEEFAQSALPRARRAKNQHRSKWLVILGDNRIFLHILQRTQSGISLQGEIFDYPDNGGVVNVIC